MRRWFLSYNSQDVDLARRLKTAIERKDARADVFFAPQNLRPGTYWMPTLANEIAESTAFILLVGRNGLGPWQTLEYQEAIDRSRQQPGFAVVPLVLDNVPAPGLPFLRQLHWIITADPASEQSVARLIDAASGGGAPPGELWRHTAPYRGLAAMRESDADFFFGRDRETTEVIGALAATAGKLPLLLGNSGVGKSSLAQAGVVAALMRQDWPQTDGAKAGEWPQMFRDSRGWCFLTMKPGAEPLRALVDPFLSTWQFEAVDAQRAKLKSDWVKELLDGSVGLRDLLDATQAHYREKLHQPEPPAFLLYIDQGEELYVRQAAESERRRFSEVLAQALPDPRLRVMMSMRADFFGELQKDEALYSVHRLVNVPPLRETKLRDVVSKPADLLSARFETPQLVDIITRRTAEDSVKNVGALPLLSYTLDDMWKQMVKRGDATLRLPAQSFDLSGVLVGRANAFLETHPGAEAALRRILTLRLAAVREDGEPTRRRAPRAEFTDEEWRLVSELADDPNRLLVTATDTEIVDAEKTSAEEGKNNGPAHSGGRGDATEGGPVAGETYAEVTHEAIFRRWDKLREWIATERKFLAWRSGLEAARSSWQAAPERSKGDALLMGFALEQAQIWFLERAEDLHAPDREFIAQSIQRNHRAQARARVIQAAIYGLTAAVILGLVGWIEQAFIREQWLWWTIQRPFLAANFERFKLTPQAEQALRPGDRFRECAPRQQGQDYCPEMVVVPDGTFEMGSRVADMPQSEKGEVIASAFDEPAVRVDKNRLIDELPVHRVTIAKPFAVSQFELTFAEWDVCVANAGCNGYRPSDASWGGGERPVIYVSWDDAQRYLTWLSKVTGKTYRLLTEAEYEYAARAGTTTEYPWGDEIGTNNAHCLGCGSQWHKQTAPVGSFTASGFVGSFAPNKFALYDMVGNVWEWVEDCYHPNYLDAPTNGSAWVDSGTCSNRVVRGGSWNNSPFNLRSADRDSTSPVTQSYHLGFRVARTLAP
jgi:formylglycine-generating enzyme required for sulfatase activity